MLLILLLLLARAQTALTTIQSESITPTIVLNVTIESGEPWSEYAAQGLAQWVHATQAGEGWGVARVERVARLASGVAALATVQVFRGTRTVPCTLLVYERRTLCDQKLDLTCPLKDFYCF